MAIQQQVQFGQAYRYTDVLPSFVQQQCVRCGAFVGGSFDGLRPVNDNGLVVLLQGPNMDQVVCSECHENEEADYFQTR